MGSLADDAAAIDTAIGAIGGDVVVVAHSYGGVPVTQAQLGPRARHIIYLGAFMPDVGQSLVSLLPPGPLPPFVQANPDGSTAVAPGQAKAAFYADCSDEVVSWAEGRLKRRRHHHPGQPRKLARTHLDLHCSYRRLRLPDGDPAGACQAGHRQPDDDRVALAVLRQASCVGRHALGNRRAALRGNRPKTRSPLARNDGLSTAPEGEASGAADQDVTTDGGGVGEERGRPLRRRVITVGIGRGVAEGGAGFSEAELPFTASRV
jgi:hypothetical protein